MAFGEPICGPASFHAECRWQRVCAWCGSNKPWQAHHVLREQNLKRLGISGRELYDTRNALRLCLGCHGKHHHGHPCPTVIERAGRIDPVVLDVNILYAVEKAGRDGALSYFERYYANSDLDARLTELASRVTA